MRRFSYFFQETMAGLRRNGLMAFAAVSTVFISLFLFGGALLIGRQVNLVVDATTEKVEVAVFLQDNISDAQRDNLDRLLLKMNEVARVQYESKQEAYRRFVRIFHDYPALTNNVSHNALPASFRVKLRDPSKFDVVRARLVGQPGIETIRDQRDILNKLFAVANVLRLGAFVAAIVMLISASALIANTIRVAVFARRREIGIMRLVGATNWFIRMPFVLEGTMEGLVGAGLAIVTLAILRRVFFNSIHNYITFWPVIPSGDVIYSIPILLGIGVAVAVVASVVAMRRFLEV